MARQEAIKALIAICCYIILSLSILRDRATELEQHRRQSITKRRRQDDDDIAAIRIIVPNLVAESVGYSFRRFWVDERSQHWITGVLSGTFLQNDRFQRTFRMSRNSFELLHGILGTYINHY